MSPRNRYLTSPHRLVAGAAAALMVASVLAIALSARRPPGPAPAAAVRLDPPATVRDFFDRYVSTDGRVARVDQGGDTVSEGQAYALLMAASVGDRARFLSVWSWTRQHLLLPDGLLAWHWRAGAIVDRQSASDADLGAAAALVMASKSLRDPSLQRAARSLSAAILAHEVASTPAGRALTAGPWAVKPTEYVNPSYLAPAELGQLAAAFRGPWPELAARSDAQLVALTSGGTLPSDWAVIGSDYRIHPSAPPQAAGQPARFGFDAVRAPIWMATSCDARLRAAAAGLLPALQRGDGEVNLDLGGHPAPGTRAPVGRLAAAAAEWAAGRTQQAWSLVETAARANRSHPTYYGTAWVALTTLAFDHALQTCPA